MTDKEAIQQVLENYVQGGTEGNKNQLRSAFHPEAKIKFLREGTFQEVGVEDFLSWPAIGKKHDRYARNISFQQRGEIGSAHIVLEYSDFRFVDFFHLIKEGGQWFISNKIFYREEADENTLEQEALRAVYHYFEGTAKGDINLLKEGFTEDCKIYFINEEGAYDFLNQEQFHQIVRESATNFGERINRLISIDIVENMARAHSRSDFESFYFEDYLNLLKIGDAWKIVAKCSIRKAK